MEDNKNLILDIKDLVIHYETDDGVVEAVNGIDIQLEHGKTLGLVGETGSGKTTFLNALSNFIPEDERIITIEDSAELQIQNIANLVRLEARNRNVEGKNEVTIRDLVKSALRMRPEPHHYEIVRFRA